MPGHTAIEGNEKEEFVENVTGIHFLCNGASSRY